jgi:ComF family protein
MAPSLAKISAYTLKKRFPLIVKYWYQNNFCLIPTPLHHFRQNWRGFNQASLIGKSLAKLLNIPFNSNLVIKTKYTLTQAKTSHKALRLKNQQNTFSFNSSSVIASKAKQSQPIIPSNIIIFDDVYTTGATTTSLAKIFPKNTSIWVLSLV